MKDFISVRILPKLSRLHTAFVRIIFHMSRVAHSLVLSDIIHGDVKPLNALVFEHDGKRIVSSLILGMLRPVTLMNYNILLPNSMPWNAPEHHIRGISFSKPTKMDIYSFGMPCL